DRAAPRPVTTTADATRSTGLQPTWLRDDHPTSGTVATHAPGDDRISRLAGALAARGVQRGDAVAWQLPNSDEAALLLWACWHLGAAAVPVHHLATAVEFDRIVASLPVRHVVEHDEVDRMVEHGEPVG